MNLRNLKLPEIPFSMFFSLYEHWEIFKSNLDSLITNNDLNKEPQLFYLQASLKGEDKQLKNL